MNESIHIGIDYNIAKESKKKILLSQINLLEIKKNLSNYKKLRLQELRKKEKIKQKIKGVKADIIKLEKLLPKPKIPKTLQTKGIEHTEVIKETTITTTPSHLERQLQEIKSKLQKLQKE